MIKEMRKNNIFITKEGQRGQMLLIVILTMVVALTVGLSLVSRTITNLKISKQNEESQRALQAAEAGVEKALQSAGATTLSGQFSNNNTGASSFNTTITSADGTNLLLNNGDEVDQDTGVDIWLSDYPSYQNSKSPTLTVYWGTSQNTCSGSGDFVVPAVEIAVLSVVNPTGSLSDPANLRLSKYIVEGSTGVTSCTRVSGAATPGGGGTVTDKTGRSVTFKSSYTLPSITNGLIMKVIPLYNSAKMGVVSSVALPAQGSLIESVGKSGDTARKVIYFQAYPQLPVEVFPYSILSSN